MTVREMLKLGEAVTGKYGAKYNYIGVRVQDRPEKVGTKLTHVSHVWEDGEETEEEMRGVSAINADTDPTSLSRFTLDTVYRGGYVLILGGEIEEFGQDEGEIVMERPVVLEVARTRRKRT